jgi:hypothetical protein
LSNETAPTNQDASISTEPTPIINSVDAIRRYDVEKQRITVLKSIASTIKNLRTENAQLKAQIQAQQNNPAP